MAVFRSSRLVAYFLTIIAGIGNTQRLASDFSNASPLASVLQTAQLRDSCGTKLNRFVSPNCEVVPSDIHGSNVQALLAVSSDYPGSFKLPRVIHENKPK